jgi:hypothetical protein
MTQDVQTNSTVIIKLLLFGVDFSWDDLKLFQWEVEVLQDLNLGWYQTV